MTEFASCWGLILGALLVASPVILFRINDHTDMERDLAMSDETAQDIVGAKTIEDQPEEHDLKDLGMSDHKDNAGYEQKTTTHTAEHQDTVELTEDR